MRYCTACFTDRLSFLRTNQTFTSSVGFLPSRFGMLYYFIGHVACVTDDTLYILVLPRISFCINVRVYLKLVTCFYALFIVEIIVKVLIYTVYIYV